MCGVQASVEEKSRQVQEKEFFDPEAAAKAVEEAVAKVKREAMQGRAAADVALSKKKKAQRAKLEDRLAKRRAAAARKKSEAMKSKLSKEAEVNRKLAEEEEEMRAR